MVIETPQDHARIEGALAAARSVTSAEIRLVATNASSHYGGFALIHALIAALIAGAIPVVVFPGLPAYFVIVLQAAIGAIALLCLQNRWLRQELVPNAALRKAAWRQARLTYAHIRLQSHSDRPLVLLYCSRLERSVEILTEDPVLAHVPVETWQRIITEFKPHMRRADEAAAFVHLIEESAAALKPFYPAQS
jgi:putative membrane protein